jgi:sulfoxide reductase heme-binding subunit YedZ
MIVAATHGPSPLWYATRGAGAMTLVLLTLSVVLGIAEVRRWPLLGSSRFAVAALHRTVSLLALVLLIVHIVTTLLDPFPPIGVLTALVPFAADYRPLWLGFGTLASDVLVALVLTSLLRRRLGYGAWRATHWAAYACWPLAIAHGLGTGSDTQATWMLALTLACVAAPLLALAGRLARPGSPAGARTAVAAAAVLAAAALAIWLPQGPLARGWASKAGTPRSVLAAFGSPAAGRPVRTARRVAATARTTPVDRLARPFTAALRGKLRSGVSAGGTSVVDLRLRLGTPHGVLRIRLGGPALSGGGLQMDRSAVTLGPLSDTGRYQGRIQVLQNTHIQALVGSSQGRALRLRIDLVLGNPNGTVTGRVQSAPAKAA